ncbi:MAG: DUF6449 domain-containing protein [Eubacteriales bacterium]|nr:DUF6449 domain-containing protein [Eubacteriales bacterium]
MMRKSSSCKLRASIRKCCGRNAALFTVSLLLQLIAMPVCLIMQIHAQMRYVDLSDIELRESVRQSVASILQENLTGSLALIFLAVLTGIVMFRYLHVRKQTDFFHALPVTRGHLFAAHTLAGVLAVVPAYLLSVVLSCCICAAYGFADAIVPSVLLLSVVVHLAGFLLVYAVSILAAIVSGNTLVSLLVCAWFQFGLLAGYEMVDELLYILYPARVSNPEGIAPIWLSPVVEAIAAIQPLGRDWTEHTYWMQCVLPAVLCLLAAGILLALGYYLNRIRKSEHTGLSIAFPKFEQPFKLYMVSVVAIACGLIFQTTMESWMVLYISMAIGGLVTACVVEIVYDLDFHSLFRRWKSFAVYCAVCVVVLGCMAADVTRWNSTLPEREEIVSASLQSGVDTWDCSSTAQDDDLYYYSDRFYAMLSRVYRAAGSSYVYGFNVDDVESAVDYVESTQMESADVLDTIYASASMGAEAMQHDRSDIQNADNSSYVVTFQLQNGKTFTRRYYMPDDTAELADNGADVRFSKEYRETFTEAAVAQSNKEFAKWLLVENYMDMAASHAERIDNAKAIDDILDVLYEESREITREYASQNLPVLAIRVAGQQAIDTWGGSNMEDLNNVFGSGIDDIVDIPVYACQTETLKLLGEYIDGLETGFGSEPIQKLDEQLYLDDENPSTVTNRTYSDQETIERCKPYLLPVNCIALVDGVYQLNQADGTEVTVELADGTAIECYCYQNIT